ncbi:MAG: hypothetical protein HY654_02050 [Acidobacteria bacterium]|nr:hypothetical protein [Acidobacteriota bacterium]
MNHDQEPREAKNTATGLAPAPSEDVPRFRPRERFWPYVELPEQPTPEELAALDPDLRAALLGEQAETRPFSVTVVFSPFDAPEYEQALSLARESAEYLEVRHGEQVRHRARYFARDVRKLRQLWQLVEHLHESEALINDRPLPYARELWLPLVWFLLHEY